MYIYYDEKLDYAEVFFKKAPNYLSSTDRPFLGEFREEKNDKIIGYAIDGVTQRLKKLDVLNPLQKFSLMVKISRQKKHLTQQEVANRMGIKLLPYQRIESGENNPTLKTILKLKEVLPDIKLDLAA